MDRLKQRGQFGAEKGGQFAPESGGQFSAEKGGQFERKIHEPSEWVIPSILPECEIAFFAISKAGGEGRISSPDFQAHEITF